MTWAYLRSQLAQESGLQTTWGVKGGCGVALPTWGTLSRVWRRQVEYICRLIHLPIRDIFFLFFFSRWLGRLYNLTSPSRGEP